MDVIGSEIQRLDRVVQTLVDFTRPVELRLGETDLRRDRGRCCRPGRAGSRSATGSTVGCQICLRAAAGASAMPI